VNLINYLEKQHSSQLQLLEVKWEGGLKLQRMVSVCSCLYRNLQLNYKFHELCN
jgi:hypothetical protein